MNLKWGALHSFKMVGTMTVALVIFACAPSVKKPVEEIVMERISVWSYPDFADDILYNGLEHSILKSLSYLQKIPADREFEFGPDRYNADHMILSIQHFLEFTGAVRRRRPGCAPLR